jgi:hypothetical protein
MKEFLRSLLKSLGEHWIIVLLGSGGIVTTFLGWLYRAYIKNWLLAKHSLEMYGWMWAAAVLMVGGLPIFIFWLLKKKEPRILYREDKEILVVLENKLRQYERQNQNEILLDFRECDRKWCFPKGSARRLLPPLLGKDKTWKIKHMGGNAMTIIREDPRVALLKHLEKK